MSARTVAQPHSLETVKRSTQCVGPAAPTLTAELAFTFERGGRGGGAYRAYVRYKARLVNAAGEELGFVAGEAKARDIPINQSSEGYTANAKLAVEAMYEKLATTLLATSCDAEAATSD